MPFYRFMRLIRLFCLLYLFIPFSRASILDTEREPLWNNVPKEELELLKAKISREAPAEILYSMQMLDDSNDNYTVYHYHKRIKIFQKSAIKELSKIDLVHNDSSKIEDIQARVISKDGSITPLDPSKIFQKEVYKKEGKEFFCKSFSFPSLEVGSIIEYKWTKRILKGIKAVNRFNFVKEWPVHHSTLIFKPTSNSNWQIQSNGFAKDEFKKTAHNRYEMSLYNLDSFPNESLALPKHNLQKWLLIRYSNKKELPDSWDTLAEKISLLEKKHSSSSRAIRKKVKELCEDLEDPKMKAKEIYKFCQNEIQNLSYDLHHMSINKFSETKKNEKAQDTINRSYGTRSEINILFYTMLKSLKLDAKITFVNDKSHYISDCSEYDSIALPCLIIYLTIDDKGYYCDPGSPFIEFGRLQYSNEGTPALFSIKRKAHFKRTPKQAPTDSHTTRIAKLQLQANGAIKGQIDILFTGHENIIEKLSHIGLSDKQIITKLTLELEEQLPNAIISNCRISNLKNIFKAIEYHYDIEIPSYAQTTKKRIFLCTSLFEKRMPLSLDKTERKSPIYINTTKNFEDKIQIRVPITYAINSPTTEKTQIISRHIDYSSSYHFNTKTNLITYTRHCTEKAETYEAEEYPEIRELYKSIKKQDNKELVFQRKQLSHF